MRSRRPQLRTELPRRAVLRWLGGAALAAGTAPALALTPTRPAYSLSLANIHTGEKVRAVYREGDALLDDGLAELGVVLRDWRTDERHPIDPALLDYLVEVQQSLGHDGYVNIISGYRSPKTNATLAARSNGVAKKSLHMQGRAIDIALPGRATGDVRRAALALQRGGVGLYSKSGFVHLDTGNFRSWGH
ncbi:MAG: DUF882 domain-containing protein [Pseudomonadales bacterium]|nr:DUF882 domain-containing protein [Pseudomonadales bacterium]